MKIHFGGPELLESYAGIPIRFRVEAVLDAVLPERGLEGIRLRERSPSRPYVKDYDAEPGQGPTDWPSRFDLVGWEFITVRDGDRTLGGAALIHAAPEIDMLEGRDDLALIWDLRVSPECRRSGVGGMLFAAAEARARDRGCTRLKVETQNINLPACRFYAKQGCELGGIQRFAYANLPDEVQLLWYKNLGAADVL